jgi:hypothetical protein
VDFPILRSLAQLAGTPLEGEDIARVAALLDRDDTRPTPDPTQARDSDADLELESYRIDATAVGVFRIGGELVVATRELFPAPHAEEPAFRSWGDRLVHEFVG